MQVNNPNTGEYSDFSLFEVDSSDEVIYSLAPGWIPRFVDEEDAGPLEEGTHYTTHFNGTYWYVKPTTQPTAASPRWRIISERVY